MLTSSIALIALVYLRNAHLLLSALSELLLTMSLAGGDDPFRDPSLAGVPTTQSDTTNVPPTLAVGRIASLTLGTDSLIVLGAKCIS
jgi:hypothetical protein